MLYLTQYAGTKHGLAEALAAAPGLPELPVVYKELAKALGSLVRANEKAKTMRSDLDAQEVFLAFAGHFHLNPTSDWRAQATRIIDLVMTGLQY